MRGRVGAAVGVLLLGGLLSGCWFVAGAAAGAAGYAWYKGELRRSYGRSIDEAHNASLAVLKRDLKFVITEDTPNRIKAKMPDGREVAVRLKYLGEKATEVGVKVGLLGDRSISELVLSKISSHLGEK